MAPVPRIVFNHAEGARVPPARGSSHRHYQTGIRGSVEIESALNPLPDEDDAAPSVNAELEWLVRQIVARLEERE